MKCRPVISQKLQDPDERNQRLTKADERDIPFLDQNSIVK